jgi:hypothetical protein
MSMLSLLGRVTHFPRAQTKDSVFLRSFLFLPMHSLSCCCYSTHIPGAASVIIRVCVIFTNVRSARSDYGVHVNCGYQCAVEVTDANEPPVIFGHPYFFEIQENSTAGEPIFRLLLVTLLPKKNILTVVDSHA